MRRAAAALAALVLASLCALPAGARDEGPNMDVAHSADLFMGGEFDAAAKAYAAVLAEHPGEPYSELGLGTVQLYRNDLAAAKPLLEAAAKAMPDDARAAGRLRELQRRESELTQTATIAGDAAILPFVTASPLPLVEVKVDGHAAVMLVDTGANFILETAFAKTLGLALTPNGNGVFAGGKTAPMQMTTVAKLEMGGATAGNVPATVMDAHASDLFPMGQHVDGILGTSVFERFLATIDYPNARLILRPRAASAAFLRAAAAKGAAIEPCWLAGDHFVVARARVNDAPAGLFLFDSGLAGGGVSPTRLLIEAAHIALDAKNAGSGIGGGGTVTTIPFVAKTVAAGSAVQHDVRGLFTPEGDPLRIFPFTVWGIISNDFLAHYAYTVDFVAMKIVLAPAGT